MKLKLSLTIVCSVLAIVLAGCLTSASKLTQIHLGMTKAEVRTTLGQPTAARGSVQNKFDQTIEVWEYIMDRGFAADGVYWLYFHDDKLVQWGAAGDWRKEADRIYEIRFGPTGTIP
jgi:outer membrane protein assembly factor BamE (lipoprotein component of BamABCDE complex)